MGKNELKLPEKEGNDAEMVKHASRMARLRTSSYH